MKTDRMGADKELKKKRARWENKQGKMDGSWQKQLCKGLKKKKKLDK